VLRYWLSSFRRSALGHSVILVLSTFCLGTLRLVDCVWSENVPLFFTLEKFGAFVTQSVCTLVVCLYGHVECGHFAMHAW